MYIEQLCYGSSCERVSGLWTQGEKKAKFGYDFWYQPHWDVMISTEWGAPKSFKKGFALPDTQDEGISSSAQHSADSIRSACSVCR
jgi:selenium-binding protein 1